MKSLSKGRDAQEDLQADLKAKLIIEQYKQLHNDILDSSRIRWQIIGLGSTLLVTLLATANSTLNIASASILSGLAIPISLLLFVAYRKEAYFENLYNETMEEIERRYGILHVQRDTLPQKEADLHYLIRLPIKRSLESLSSYTIFLALLLMFHTVATVSFLYYFGHATSTWVALSVALAVDFFLLTLSMAADQSQRRVWWQRVET